MIERVLPGMGLLGPVGDAEAMAANIQRVWEADPRGMGRLGRDHVAGEFSWAHTMDVLFTRVIPAAFAHRGAALQQSFAGASVPLVEA